MKVNAFLALGLGWLAGIEVMIAQPARAMSGPPNIQIDGGPLGPLEFSGGIDFYLYGQTGTSDRQYPRTSVVGDDALGANFQTVEITLQKATGVVGFNLQVAGYYSYALGVAPLKQATIKHYTTGPLRVANVTITPPNSGLTFSVGQFNALESYEGAFNWQNPTGFVTVLSYEANSASRGVTATYKRDGITGEVALGDGNDTGVFNFLQFLLKAEFDAHNGVGMSGGIPLGITGPNAFGYGGTTVGNNGIYTVNSSIYSVWYTWTHGNLKVVPEIQYQYANPLHRYAAIGFDIPKRTDNYGAAVFADYRFGNSPYSLGAWVEYANSHGSATNWFIAPNAELAGLAVAPTWQDKNLFARLNCGYVHLLNGSYNGTGIGAYGNRGRGRDLLVGTLEVGVMF